MTRCASKTCSIATRARDGKGKKGRRWRLHRRLVEWADVLLNEGLLTSSWTVPRTIQPAVYDASDHEALFEAICKLGDNHGVRY